MDLFYIEKIRPAVEGAQDVQKAEMLAAAAEDGLKAAKLPSKLSMIMKKAREMFKQESAETKAAVDEHWKEMVAEMELERNGKKGAAAKSAK